MSEEKILSLNDEDLKDVAGGIIYTSSKSAIELDDGGWGCPLCGKKMRYLGMKHGSAYAYCCDEHGGFARYLGDWYSFG